MEPRPAIFLMRHAKSSWGDAGLADHDRPLNKRGLSAAPFMGKELKRLGCAFDVVYVSTAKRAQQTAELVLAELDFSGDVVATERLYLAEPSVYFDLLAEVPYGSRRVLFIAHNPGIADFAALLSNEDVHMCTAGIAEIECQAPEVADVDSTTPCRLKGFYRPPRGRRRDAST